MKFSSVNFYINAYLKDNIGNEFRNFISRFNNSLESKEFFESDLLSIFMYFKNNEKTIQLYEYDKQEAFNIYLKYKRERLIEDLLSLDRYSEELQSQIKILSNVLINYNTENSSLKIVIEEDIKEIKRILKPFENNVTSSFELQRNLKSNPLIQTTDFIKLAFIESLYYFLVDSQINLLLDSEVSLEDFQMLFEVNPKSKEFKINLQKNNSFVIILLDELEPYIPDFNIKYFTSIGVFYNKKGEKITSESLYTARSRIKNNNSKDLLKFKNDLKEFLEDNI